MTIDGAVSQVLDLHQQTCRQSGFVHRDGTDDLGSAVAGQLRCRSFR
jgi:hypothetical protein